MFNNSSEKNRYSLRKLSVGLASVLIGISFIEANGQTAKADTVDGGNTATISTNVEKTANGAGNAANDANDTNSINARQESTKETTSTQNYAADISAETTASKTKAVRSTVQGAKAALNAENDIKNDANVTNGTQGANDNSVASDAKVANGQAKQVAKDINEEATKDTQVAKGADTQTLVVTKNSKALDSKALAANLTETNNLPAFGSASLDDRATGTKHTRVGDTRLSDDQLKHIAISSDIKLTLNGKTDQPYKDGQIANIKMNQSVFVGLTGTTTIDKNDLKKGNNILIGTVQMSNDRYGQVYDKVPDSELNMNNVIGGIGYDSQSESHEPEVANASYQQAVNIDYDGKQLGRVTIAGLHDRNEFDIYLHVDNEFNFVTNPTFTFKQNFFLAINNGGGGQNSAVFTGIKPKDSLNVQFDTNTHKYQVHFNYAQINAPLVTTVGTNDSNTISIDTSAKRIYLNNGVASHFFNTDKYGNYDPNNFTFKDNGEYDEAIKITSSSNNSITNIISYARANKFVRNADNKALGGDLDTNWGEHAIATTRKADNLTAKDLLDQTPAGTASWSKQADGSVIVAEKLIRSNFTSIPINLASKTWATTAVDPNHAQQIIQNTNKHVNDHNWSNNIWFGLANNSAATITVTDITPQNYSPYVGHKMKSILGTTDSNGSGSTTAETWRYANISYVDDDNNETEMNKNIIQGLRDKGTEYTIQIPKGYSLVDPKDGTNYKWNADHTKITYTFADDQAKNDANPIVIHLKHNHSAVKDNKYLKNTSVRTITFDFPAGHGDPEAITQTIGWTRTGTYDEVTAAAKGLDEAEKEGNYTDWVFTSDPAATKVTVTVNGKSDAALASKYQSYDQQAYAKDNSDVEFAAIPIPKIPGYKATFTHDSANPAMLLVSFIALPDQNHDINESKDNHDTTSTDPVQPVNPSDDTKHDSSDVEVPSIPSDPKDNQDITAPDEPKVPTVPVDTDAAKNIPVSDDASDVITMDKPANAPVNAEMHVTDSTWHIKDEATTDAAYIVVNSEYELQLPRFNGYTLRLVKRNAARDAISFVYVNPNKTLKYVFNIKIANGKYILAISKVSKDGIIPLEKVTFSDYNQLIQLIAKAVNR